jgi:hypothetical protein
MGWDLEWDAARTYVSPNRQQKYRRYLRYVLMANVADIIVLSMLRYSVVHPSAAQFCICCARRTGVLCMRRSCFVCGFMFRPSFLRCWSSLGPIPPPSPIFPRSRRAYSALLTREKGPRKLSYPPITRLLKPTSPTRSKCPPTPRHLSAHNRRAP